MNDFYYTPVSQYQNKSPQSLFAVRELTARLVYQLTTNLQFFITYGPVLGIVGGGPFYPAWKGPFYPETGRLDKITIS